MPRVPGCSCPQCYTLREWMLDHRMTPPAGLPEAPGHETARLRVVTGPRAEPLTAPACSGLPTCPCAACARERDRLVRRGVRETPRQPWEPKARASLRDAA